MGDGQVRTAESRWQITNLQCAIACQFPIYNVDQCESWRGGSGAGHQSVEAVMPNASRQISGLVFIVRVILRFVQQTKKKHQFQKKTKHNFKKRHRQTFFAYTVLL